ncbi:MAG TPA: DUF2254 domain-containing protein [Catenuloplanes sp.]
MIGPGSRSPRAEKSRSPLWLWPAVASVVAFVGALFIVDVDLPASLRWLAWPGGTESATALLQTIAGSVITVTGLTFTLTVVALQLASQQFSPRLLRDFTRDRVIKAVLAVLLATLVFDTTVLRAIDADEPLPDVALLVTSVLGLAALGAILAFITHMTRVLRVDTMMLTVHDETDIAIDTFYPGYGDPGPRSPDELDLDGADAMRVAARTSGFVRRVDVAGLLSAAREHDVVVSIEARPGDHIVRGTPLATVWTAGDGRAPTRQQQVRDAVTAAVVIGYERTVEQDAAFGFRQLTDIAVKALSPGINDPVTAAHAVGHMADLLVRLTGRRLGPTLHEDADGTGRVVVPDRDLPYYLELVCGPVRRYGRSEPTVLIALLRMLRDVASAVRDDAQREDLADQVGLIVGEVSETVAAHDAKQVQAMADRVRQAVDGDITGAYHDRSGETRSI